MAAEVHVLVAGTVLAAAEALEAGRAAAEVLEADMMAAEVLLMAGTNGCCCTGGWYDGC